MANKKSTSKAVATLASTTLQDPRASETAKTLAASALAQSRTKKEPSPELEQLASNVLQSDKYNDKTKTLAASVLAQSDKSKK